MPYTLYADSPGGLLRFFRETFALHPPGGGAGLEIAEEQIRHEAEHGAAARSLGCSVRFTFSMVPRPGGWEPRAGSQWVSRVPLSRLAAASIYAAPSRLSPADTDALRAAGYPDPEDLAGRIREFNRTADHPLPVPSSGGGPPRTPGTVSK